MLPYAVAYLLSSFASSGIWAEETE
jgi:hypothetical protein